MLAETNLDLTLD